MVLDVRERCAGGGHAGDLDGGVGIALADVRGGFRGVLGHVTHAVEGVFAVFGAVDGDEGVEALFGRHLVVAVRTVENVVEAAVRLPEREKIIRQRVAAFHKAAVIQRNPQLTERDDDLRSGFDVRRAPGGVAALAVLGFGKPGKGLVGGGLDGFLVLIFGEGLQGHGGHVGVGIAGAGEVPAAVSKLVIQDLVDVELACGLGFGRGVFRDVVAAGIEGDERPDGAVEALPDRFFEIAQRGQEVIARDVRRVAADGGQGEDDAGIFGVLPLVQHAGAVFDVLLDARVVIVKVIRGDRIAGTGQADDGPLAADGADLRRFDGGEHVGGAALQFALDAGGGQGRGGQRGEDAERQDEGGEFTDFLHHGSLLRCGGAAA